MIIPDEFFLLAVFILALMLFVVDLPCVFENWRLRKERNKFLDKLHNHEREVNELKKKIKALKKENKDYLSLNYSLTCERNALARENFDLKNTKVGESK